MTGYVYVIGTSEGPHKVGMSRDVKKRLGTLQNAAHERLSVHFVAKSDRPQRHERALHDELRAYRRVGEWFSCDVETIRDAASAVGLEPDAFCNRPSGPRYSIPDDLASPMTAEEFRSWASEMRKWPIFQSDDDLAKLLGTDLDSFRLMKANGASYLHSLACRALKHNMAPYSINGPISLIDRMRAS